MRRTIGREPLNDRWVWSLVAVAAGGAELGRHLGSTLESPWYRVAAVAAALWALRRRWPWLLVVAVGLGSTAHSAAGWTSLRRPLPASISGLVTVVGDARPGVFGTDVVVARGGRRFVLSVSTSVTGRAAADAGDLAWGDTLDIRSRLRGLTAPTPMLERLHVSARGSPTKVELVRRARGPLGLVNAVRGVVFRCTEGLGEDQRSLLRAMLLGDDRDVAVAQSDRFRRAGLFHVMVVSGQNLSMLLAALDPFARLASARVRWATTLAVIGWFVLLVRPEPSVLRAALSATVMVVAQISGRKVAPMRALALGLTVIAVGDPLIVRSVGLWMSAAASAGLACIAPRLAGAAALWWPRAGSIASALREAAAATIGAQLAVAPFLLWLGGPIALSSVPANVVAAPLVVAITVVGGVATALAALTGLLTLSSSWPVLWRPLGWIGTAVDNIAAIAAAHPLVSIGWVGLGAAVGAWAVLRRSRWDRGAVVQGAEGAGSWRLRVAAMLMGVGAIWPLLTAHPWSGSFAGLCLLQSPAPHTVYLTPRFQVATALREWGRRGLPPPDLILVSAKKTRGLGDFMAAREVDSVRRVDAATCPATNAARS